MKIAGSSIGAICSVGVYLWAKRARGEWFAFVATFVLLTSTRFVKYSKGFLLDPLLAAFSVWALYLLISGVRARSEKNKFFSCQENLCIIGSGVFLAGAFLTKGAFALAPVFVAFIFLLWNFFSTDRRLGALTKNLTLLTIGIGTPIAAWLYFGDGLYYLERYWVESVSGRVRNEGFPINFGPMRNLLAIYWPWLPFLILGTYKIFRSRAEEVWEKSAATMAFVFLGGLSVAGLFLEHYLATFYAFAAIIVAVGIPEFAPERKRKITFGILSLLVTGALLMAITPTLFHKPDWKNPIRNTLKDASAQCQSSAIKRIAISTSVSEIWLSLAMGGWHTQWDTWSGPGNLPPSDSNSDLLVAHKNEKVDSNWLETGIQNAEVVLYRSSAIESCGKN